MRQILLTASLLFSLGLSACADHSGAIASVNPPGPIGPSDGNNVGPTPDDLSGALPGSNGGFNGGTPPGDGGGGGSKGGGGTGGGGGSKGGGGTGGGGGSKGGGGTGGGGKGGGQAGSPVPEPGTMLLVGTGLAGAALMRRRRKSPEQPTS